MPEDQGEQLIAFAKHKNQPLLGVSNASIVNGQGRHTWLLTTSSL
jgi:hypothetical protein